MKTFKLLSTATLAVMALYGLYGPQAHAANISFNDINIALSGGVSANAMYFENPGFLRRHDSYILNDAIVEIAPENQNTGRIQFYAALGILQQQGIDRIYAPIPPVDLGLQYGWLRLTTYNGRYIEIGQLNSKLGIESPISYKNAQALLGAVYSAQPNYYPGARFNGPLGSYKYYIDVSNDPTIGDASAAAGIYKQSEYNRFAVSYYKAFDSRETIDMVYSQTVASLTLAVNIDLHLLEDPFPNQDKNAVGVALYASYRREKWKWPLRLEYLQDGNTGIYGYDKGYTVSFSPTYQFDQGQALRVELIAAQADANPFRDSDGGFTDSQYIVAAQLSVQF